MKHFEAGGVLAASLTVLAVAGGSNEQAEAAKIASLPVAIADGRGDVQLYKRPYNETGSPGPKGPVLKVGAEAVATCFARNDNELLSSVRVRAGRVRGYAGIYALQGSKDSTPTRVFDVAPATLKRKLRACK